LRNSH